MSAPIWRRGDAYPEAWPQWLRDADIEWCRVEISECGRVCWISGEWHGGEWHGGTWHVGDWCGGDWRGGVWCGGRWHGGEWHNGTWFDGRWYDGEAWRTDGPPRSGGAK